MANENKTVPDARQGTLTDQRSEQPASSDGAHSDFQDILKRLAGNDLDAPLPSHSKIGQYEVEQELGSGGFGTVYRCRDPVIGKVVAIKVLRRQFSLDPIVAERFLEEARAAARIGHEGIVDVFGFGALPDGRRYLVMEYIEGHTLSELMTATQAPALSLEEKLLILEQVAGALDAAHEAGIVHRDVKPANVFVSRSSRRALRTKLLDFGIAKRLDDEAPQRTSGGQILGTPAYMSPEQCEARPVTPAADIYSLGVMAFELLTGQRPLNAASATALRAAHVRTEPALASEVSAALPRGVDLPLKAMLAKDPEDRPRSASEPIAEVAAAIARAEKSAASRRVTAIVVGVATALAGGLLMTGSHEAAIAPTGSTEPERSTSVAPAPSATDVRPTTASSVVVRVVAAPPGATLRDESGTQYDVNEPVRLERGTSPLKLTLSAPLHQPRQVELVPDRDQELDGKLAPAASSHPTAPAHKKRSTELEY